MVYGESLGAARVTAVEIDHRLAAGRQRVVVVRSDGLVGSLHGAPPCRGFSDSGDRGEVQFHIQDARRRRQDDSVRVNW